MKGEFLYYQVQIKNFKNSTFALDFYLNRKYVADMFKNLFLFTN